MWLYLPRCGVTEYQPPLHTHKWNKMINVTVSPQMWSTPENWTRSRSQRMICPWLGKTTRRCQQKRNQTWNCSCQSVRLPWAMQSFLRNSSQNSCLYLMGWVVPGLGVFGCPLWSIATELCREGKCLGLSVCVCLCVCVCVCAHICMQSIYKLWWHYSSCKRTPWFYQYFWAGWLRSATAGPNDSCTLTCFQMGCVWPKPDQAIQIRSGLVLHNMIQAFSGRLEANGMQEVGSGIYDPAQFWLHTGHNGWN